MAAAEGQLLAEAMQQQKGSAGWQQRDSCKRAGWWQPMGQWTILGGAKGSISTSCYLAAMLVPIGMCFMRQ